MTAGRLVLVVLVLGWCAALAFGDQPPPVEPRPPLEASAATVPPVEPVPPTKDPEPTAAEAPERREVEEPKDVEKEAEDEKGEKGEDKDADAAPEVVPPTVVDPDFGENDPAATGTAPAGDWPPDASLEPAEPPADPEADAVAVGLNQAAVEPAAVGDDEPFDPCVDPRPRKDWLDKFSFGVYRTVCGSAQWLDRFFGGDRGHREEDSSYGRVGFGLAWDDAEGIHLRGRFKARVQLPRLENRVNAFLGRFEEDEFVEGRSEDIGSVPVVFRDTQEKTWLLGLGYNPVRSARSRLDVDAGIKVDFPVDPFVKVTYRYYLFVSDTRLLRFGQIAFWTNQLGAGTTTRLDYEKALSERYHLRWQGLGTMAQEIDGLEWRSSITLYQYLGEHRAIAWLAEVEGETEEEIPLEEYGFRAVYRQRFLRDDLFLELQGRVFWPQLVPDGDRETTVGVGIGFELLWGRNDLVEARERFIKRRNKVKQPSPTRNP